MDKKENQFSNFKLWMLRVDSWGKRIVGRGFMNLPDIGYLDLFKAGTEPKAAVIIALEKEGVQF